MTNVVFRKLSGWVGALACASLLAACGGGGGSAGTNPNKPSTGTGATTAASVTVTSSSSVLASSGQSGTEVTLTALVKDANNSAVAGATVTFAASSGAVGAISGVSDASGIVTAKLNTGGDASLRDISVTASAGSVKSAAITVKVVSPTQLASVSLAASSTLLASSGQPGTEVLLTALVKDASNNAVAGASVTFTADSGSVGSVSGVSDANGIVTAKLSTGGDTTLRDINVTAAVGEVKSAPVTIKVVKATQTLTLTTDSGTLASSGAPGTEVNVTALVRDSNNAILPGVKVTLSTDSGTLTSASNITDAQGKVTAKLSTGGDATTRVITITGIIDGVPPVTASVAVSGTTVKVTASPTVNVGSSTDVSVKLVDSAGNPLANKPVTFSSTFAGNALAVKGGGAAVTNSSGQLILSYTANAVPTSGSDTITVRAMGESSSTSIAVSAITFTVTPSNSVANINTCVSLAVHRDVPTGGSAGSVLVSSSRGTVYTDINCTTAQTLPQALDGNGNTTLYVKAANPGIATLTANITNGGPITQNTMEFVSPLTSSAVITVQAGPAVISVNTGGGTSQQSTIRAEVRDGTAANNLVKNAQVTFSVVNDSSGGYLTQPAVVTTGSDGSASVSYVAGTVPTALNGVVIRAQLQGASTASNTASLTVSGKSLFISAGTGREIGTPSSTTYSLDYAVLVTDASGNAVSGVNITASVLPRHYRKGVLVFPGTTGPWQLPEKTSGSKVYPYPCPNEDANNNGVLDSGEDFNSNGRLDPGLPVSVTSNVITDANGRATVTLTYPRDRAVWLGVDLTIRGTVTGSEAVYVAYIPILPGLASDYSDQKSAPPGLTSPYGAGNPIDPVTGTGNWTLLDCKNPN